ncbi:hypothetical protein ACN2AK_22490 [Shewanella xiamenensis]|uniref:hypothetical protein n=1 Tax=Shewanella xiamenensis TaxID=332186 RepID=UPI001C4ED9B7|nr:hypothetical protein [Shewanella xiamenensis]MBW0278595.1 hypothetical protein [Shewanella xiamenensis]
MLDLEDIAESLGVGLSEPIGHLATAIRDAGDKYGAEEYRGLYISEALSRVAVGDADDFARQDPTGEVKEEINNICSAGDEVVYYQRNEENRDDPDYDNE